MALAHEGRRKSRVRATGTAAPARAVCAADPHAWALQQADWLRDGFELNNKTNIADVARREPQSTRSAVRLVVHHRLTWDVQPERRSRSGVLTIRTQRREVDRRSIDSPCLGPQVTVPLEQACPDPRGAALRDSGLPEAAIPLARPYTWDAIMSRPIEWPEQP